MSSLKSLQEVVQEWCDFYALSGITSIQLFIHQGNESLLQNLQKIESPAGGRLHNTLTETKPIHDDVADDGIIQTAGDRRLMEY